MLHGELLDGVLVDVVLLLVEVAGDADDLRDLVAGHFLALLAEALTHLREALPGIDELHLALPARALAVGDDPEVGGDAGVVEELVGQGDHGLEPVVLDDPAADLALATAGGTGE